MLPIVSGVKFPEVDGRQVTRVLQRNDESCVALPAALLLRNSADYELAKVRTRPSLHEQQPLGRFVSAEVNESQSIPSSSPSPSEAKAALTIQARWRGFLVRRTHPLEQLQVIHCVRQDLVAHMTVLSDPAMYDKLCADAHERIRWGECAMALLLRLDAVQGAHEHVRDIRKMVTKEVITFQQIVDSTSTDDDAIIGNGTVGKSGAGQSLNVTSRQRVDRFVSSSHVCELCHH